MLLQPDEDNKYREQFDKLVAVVKQLNPYVNE
jgi:hypothetical protein